MADLKKRTDMADEAAANGSVIGKILWSVLIYCLLLSIEEIVMGIVTRLIWRKQYKIVL